MTEKKKAEQFDDKYFDKLKVKTDKAKEKVKQKELDQLAASIKPSEEPEEKTDYLKYSIWLVAIIVIGTLLITSIIIIMKAGAASPDESMIGLIYIMSSGWFILMPLIPVIFMARKEIFTKLKMFGRRSKVIILRFIGGDTNEIEIISTIKGNVMEVGENRIIINPRKTTLKDGIRVLTYVSDNALAHNYYQDPKDTITEIGKRIKKMGAHDPFNEMLRIDARNFNETFLAAQQTNPDILKQIISFLTSKNIIGFLLAIAILAGAAALFSLQANNALNTLSICQTGTITP